MIKSFIAALAAVFSVSAVAGPINGTMAFSGDIIADEAALLAGNEVISFANVSTYTTDRTGDFASTIQGNLTGNFFNNITIAGGAITVPISPLWSVTDGVPDGSDNAAFSMTSATYTIVDIPGFGDALDFFTITGTGTLTLDGFDPTAGEFYLSSEDDILTFSASTSPGDVTPTSVAGPDTLALLGLGVVGLVMARKQRK